MTLKTAALMIFMCCSALLIPAESHSRSFTQAERDEAYLMAQEAIASYKQWDTASKQLSFSDIEALDRLPPEVAELNLAGLYLGRTHNQPGTQVEDISILRNMPSLRVLNLAHTRVLDLTPVERLAGLETLDISGLSISSIDTLSGLQNIKSLRIDDTQVRDLSPLRGMANLSSLFIANTPVSDLSLLQNKTKLETLHLRNTRVRDLSPLADLNLGSVVISGTNVVDLAPLINMESLQLLSAGSLSRLDEDSLRKMTQVVKISIDDNEIEDLDFLKAHSLLSLSIDDTQVSDLAQMSQMKTLRAISLDGTPVVDLKPLRDLSRLWAVSIDNTNVNDISPLAELPRLARLEMENTKVTDLSPLRGMSGLTVIGAEVPTGYEHPKQKLICLTHQVSAAFSSRQELMAEMGGLTEYYRVVSRIECGDKLHSPLYLTVETPSRLEDILDEVADLDEELRLTLLNRVNQFSLPFGRKRPETILDRVEAGLKRDAESLTADDLKDRRRIREWLIELGAKNAEDAS